MAQQSTVITDTTVLINFLFLDKVSLLAALPKRRFIITDHVKSEVTAHYSSQLQRLEYSLTSEILTEIRVDDPIEVETFFRMTKTGLGIGECSAIAVALNRGHSLAIDDKAAQQRIALLYPKIPILTTESIVIELIHSSLLSVSEADQMKDEWSANYRFRLKFESFGDRL